MQLSPGKWVCSPVDRCLSVIYGVKDLLIEVFFVLKDLQKSLPKYLCISNDIFDSG